MKLKILADENIFCVEEAFDHLGSIKLVLGREINVNMLKNIDLLLVRSVTQVDEDLLKDTSVKMVCSATIGTDHIDLNYLSQKGIAFSNAAGCNANSVAEYVVAALLELANKYNFIFSDLTLGIVGVGNIGKIVEKYARGLGISVLLNDPPLARLTNDSKYLQLDELMQADIITLHVPLNRTGIDKTVHLFDKQRLQGMKKGSFLINTSRGSVVDNHALKDVLLSGQLKNAVLDVWENEPFIDKKLLNLIEIGTPHIAGYSLDGKVNGTYQIYCAVCEDFNIKPLLEPSESLPKPENDFINVSKKIKNFDCELLEVVKKVYNIRKDDKNMRKVTSLDRQESGYYFDQLRKEYPMRREFFNMKVILPLNKNDLFESLLSLGFKVEFKN